MMGWNKVKFGEVVKINPTVSLKGDEVYSFIEMADLSAGQKYARPSVRKHLTGGARFQEGDTLFARITPCLENGKICQAKNLENGVGFGSTEFLVFRGKDGVSSTDFVYYLSRWNYVRKYAEQNLVGTSGRQRVSANVFNELELELPDLRTQTRIASILSAFDDKIELNRQMNQTLEKMAQALFKKYFVEDKDQKVLLPDYIELNPKIFIKKNEIVKYVEMADLPTSGFSINQLIFRPFNSGSKFKKNDTLLARITPCLENGKSGFVDFLKENEVAFGSTEFIVMRAKKNISPYYVYILARNEYFREHAVRSMVGTSGRQRVQTEMLNNFELNEIDPSNMKEFHQFSEVAFKQIKSNSDQNYILTQLRDILLPKLMSGEVNVEQAAATA